MLVILIANLDFPFISPRILSFSSGDGVGTLLCFNVGITDDTRVENDEQFTVSLSTRFRTLIAQGTTTINIIDNDGEILLYIFTKVQWQIMSHSACTMPCQQTIHVYNYMSRQI